MGGGWWMIYVVWVWAVVAMGGEEGGWVTETGNGGRGLRSEEGEAPAREAEGG